ncbi:GTP-binding protein [Butyrivibrio sp. INlla16]|nr:GTP-binding protein [Butyrivibrio sp. INlla16]
MQSISAFFKEVFMVIKNVNLETVIGVTSKLPQNDKPEFAFAGKSNVGKSSLINGLMNRKHYARVSQEPGKTQTINYYNINNEFYLVDLPGYGFAKVPESVKKQWGKMIENYLNKSRMLKQVFLLIDIRHEPSANDKLMYEWIVSQGVSPIIIATKSDKIKNSQLEKHLNMIKTTLGMPEDGMILPFSAQSKAGREEIYELMDRLLEECRPQESQEE